MIIRWIDDSMDFAHVVYRGRQARLVRTLALATSPRVFEWQFVSTRRYVGFWVNWRVERARKHVLRQRAADEKLRKRLAVKYAVEWEPMAKPEKPEEPAQLPEARLIS